MKKLLVVAVYAVLMACSPGKEEASLLSPQAFQEQFRPEVVLIDVRTPEEFESGSLPNSLNIDFKNEAFLDNIRLLDKEKTYLLYCASGIRSGKALEQMKQEGFKNVFALEGGLEAWKAAGMEMD